MDCGADATSCFSLVRRLGDGTEQIEKGLTDLHISFQWTKLKWTLHLIMTAFKCLT